MKMMLAFSLFALTACATITRGPNETIAVDSQPSGAAAAIRCNGGVNVTGTTPAHLVIPRRADDCVVEVSGAGRTKQVTLHRGFRGMYWVNFSGLSVITFGVVLASGDRGDKALSEGLMAGGGLTALGFLIDSVSGSMYDRDVHEVMVDLEH